MTRGSEVAPMNQDVTPPFTLCTISFQVDALVAKISRMQPIVSGDPGFRVDLREPVALSPFPKVSRHGLCRVDDLLSCRFGRYGCQKTQTGAIWLFWTDFPFLPLCFAYTLAYAIAVLPPARLSVLVPDAALRWARVAAWRPVVRQKRYALP